MNQPQEVTLLRPSSNGRRAPVIEMRLPSSGKPPKPAAAPEPSGQAQSMPSIGARGIAEDRRPVRIDWYAGHALRVRKSVQPELSGDASAAERRALLLRREVRGSCRLVLDSSYVTAKHRQARSLERSIGGRDRVRLMARPLD